MPLDGYSLRYLVEELRPLLEGARIDKINQPERFALLLQLRQGGKSFPLLLRARADEPGLFLLERNPANPAVAPRFCMLLRKHLSGGRLLSMEKIPRERIVRLQLEHRDEFGDIRNKYLILEVMGRHSNLIFTNEEERILDALVHVDSSMSSKREILPARPYLLPPSQEKTAAGDLLLEWGHRRWKDPGESLAKALLHEAADLSPFLIRGLLASLDQDPETPLNQLESSVFFRLREILLSPASPSLYYQPLSKKWEAHALHLPIPGWRCERQTSLHEALLLAQEQNEQERAFTSKKQALMSLLQKRKKSMEKKQQLHREEEKKSQHFDRKRIEAELLLAHLHLIQEGDTEVEVLNYYENPATSLKIQLKAKVSPARQAQDLFKSYNKEKRRYEASQTWLERDKQELDYLLSIENGLEAAEQIEDLLAYEEELLESNEKNQTRKQADLSKHQPELHPGKPGKKGKKKHVEKAKTKTSVKSKPNQALRPHQFLLDGGYRLLIGRNNLQNDQLSLRIAKGEDLWFHRKNAPGTHAILQCNGQEIPEATLEIAAGLCAWFSLRSEQREQLRQDPEHAERVEVDYCPARQVKKPRGAKPGFVVYEGYQTLRVRPVSAEGFQGSVPVEEQF